MAFLWAFLWGFCVNFFNDKVYLLFRGVPQIEFLFICVVLEAGGLCRLHVLFAKNKKLFLSLQLP